MTIQPLFPLWATAAVFVLLLAGLGWMEIRRPGRWLTARLVALVLVLFALAGLVLQPTRETIKQEEAILLLTKSYDKMLIDSLRDVYPKWQILRTSEAAPYPKSVVLNDLVDLSSLGRRVGAIIGEGLPAYALEYFPEKHFLYFPSLPKAGITYVQEKTYRKGQVNQVEGRYFHAGAAVKLLLKGPAVIEDSMAITEKGMQPFALDFTPKSSGRWLYELLVKDSTGLVVDKQSMPIAVEEGPQLRVLIIQAYPTFEIRYLKDFLVDRGHAVAVRSQTSKNKFRTEFANLSSRNLNRLDVELLEDFDLLIADGAAYDLLSRNEQLVLATAIDNGLGFLGLLDGDRSAFRNRLGLSSVASEPDTAQLYIGLTLPAYSVRLSSSLEWYDIHRTPSNQPVAAYYYTGKGKVGFQSAQESYTYLLQGDSLAYAALWMPVLEATLREVYPAYTIDLVEDFPLFAGEPLDFRVIAGEALKTIYSDSLVVPMQEDYALDEVWYGRTWPQEAGWHNLAVGDERLDYYAFPKDQWPSLAAAKKRRQTLKNASLEQFLAAANQETVVLKPISRLWFYLIFLLSAGFLWVAPKL